MQAAPPKRKRGERGATKKTLAEGTERRVSSRSSGSTKASYIQDDLRRSVRKEKMDVEPEQAGAYDDDATKAAREKTRS